MPDNLDASTAVAIGQQKAQEVLARRAVARAKRAQALAAHPRPIQVSFQVAAAGAAPMSATLQTAGFLVAAGDSWFDYPFFDVLKMLHDEHGYNVESAAHRGDPIEAMPYQAGQLDKLARCLEKVVAHGATPKAVLLSGGGDDIAGKEFGMLLNNSNSTIAGWNSEVVDGVLNQRIVNSYKTMLSGIEALCQHYVGKNLPVLAHGYDYPVPDGRGYWILAGPWLKPGFEEKLFYDLASNVGLMHTIIDRFNDMLAKLGQDPGFPNLHYLDLRNTLSSQLAGDAYKQSWDNELHPTEAGFSAVATKFAAVIAALP